MDNEIADKLELLFKEAGLIDITVSDQDELTTSGTEDAEGAFSIWAKVAETRGKQLVEEKYISEDSRIKAIKDYKHWINKDAVSMKLYMRSVTGYLK